MSFNHASSVIINNNDKFQSKLEDSENFHILCFNLTYYNKTTQFLLSCSGVFVLFLLYGYFQELLFTEDGFKSHGWFLTLIQFSYYIVFGLIERKCNKQRRLDQSTAAIQRIIPFNIYVILAALTLGTMGLSNSSLGYLNYPTQVIFKCCKLIPVMIGGILIQNKQYGPLYFISALAMCVGLAWFTLADSQISPNFHLFGIIMISAALLCDAAIGNVQEKAMREYKAQSSEVVLYSYSLGFLYLLIMMLITGHFIEGLLFCLKHIHETFVYSFLFSLSGYLGIHFVLALVRSSGASVAATVTTARKAVSIAISFLFFRKPFTVQYIWSGLLVVLGIYLNVYSKNHKLTFNDLKRKAYFIFNNIFVYNNKITNRKFVAEI